MFLPSWWFKQMEINLRSVELNELRETIGLRKAKKIFLVELRIRGKVFTLVELNQQFRSNRLRSFVSRPFVGWQVSRERIDWERPDYRQSTSSAKRDKLWEIVFRLSIWKRWEFHRFDVDCRWDASTLAIEKPDRCSWMSAKINPWNILLKFSLKRKERFSSAELSIDRPTGFVFMNNKSSSLSPEKNSIDFIWTLMINNRTEIVRTLSTNLPTKRICFSSWRIQRCSTFRCWHLEWTKIWK